MKNLISIFIVTLVLSSAILLTGCSSSSRNSSVNSVTTGSTTAMQTFSIAGVKSIGQAPYVIAERLGYFKEVGLSPTVTWMGGGDQVFKALTAKSVDMGLVGLVPFGFVADKFPNIKLVSVITDLNDTKLVVRNDRIVSLQDLKGKKLGYSKSTASDILLEKLSKKLGYGSGDIIGVNLAPPALATALIQGDIDGYLAREPNIQNAKKALSGNVTIFDESAYKYEWYFSLFSDESYLNTHQDVTKKFLTAMTKATSYIQSYPNESQTIVAEFLGMDKAVLQSIWSDYNFRVSIESKHYTALQDIFERASRATNTLSLVSKTPESSIYLLK